jgi:integrase
VRLEARGPALPIQDAEHCPIKKSPGLGNVRALCLSWAEARKTYKGSAERVAANALAALAGELKPHQLTALHFQSVIQRWKQTLAPATTHRYRQALLQMVKHIAHFTGNHHLIREVPRTTDPGPRTTIATAEEITRLVANAAPWMRCFLLLATSLAMRLREAASIAPANYNDQDHTISFRTKGGKTHKLPSTPELEATFAAAPPTDDPLCPYVEIYRGKRVTINTVHHEWRKLKKAAAVNPDLIIHDLRRTTAVNLYELCRDLRTVEHLLGHASIATTARYLEHRDPEKIRPLLAQLRMPTMVKQ